MNQMRVEYSYLNKQFGGASSLTTDILRDIMTLLDKGDYTLGDWVDRFEEAFAQVAGTKHAIGVSNGTDALFLIYKALGIKSAVTPTNTFLATVGAMIQADVKVELCDVEEDYLMSSTPFYEPFEEGRAIVPVHLTGRPVSEAMNVLPSIIIEDAAQAIGGSVGGRPVGSLGRAAAFSLHPLKNINVWGDGGVITTNDKALADTIRLLRNHGLATRDLCTMPGYNHRLSSIQAIVGFHCLKTLYELTSARIGNAKRYDEGLAGYDEIIIPPRYPSLKEVFHTYVIQIRDDRDGMQAWLEKHEIETKIHYPIPVHIQPGFSFLGYKEGDFPIAERQAERILSLPVHQYLTEDQVDFVIQTIQEFYC